MIGGSMSKLIFYTATVLRFNPDGSTYYLTTTVHSDGSTSINSCIKKAYDCIIAGYNW